MEEKLKMVRRNTNERDQPQKVHSTEYTILYTIHTAYNWKQANMQSANFYYATALCVCVRVCVSTKLIKMHEQNVLRE